MVKKRGKGIACMFYPIGSTGRPNAGSAFLKVNHDGTAVVFVGTVDEGQGSTTALAQIAAEELGIEFDSVRMITADSEITPYDHGTGASRSTYTVGNAIKMAAGEAKRLLLEAAAHKFKLSGRDNLVAEGGFIYFEGFPQMKISIAEAAWISEREMGRPVIAARSYTPNVTGLDPVTGCGKLYVNHIFAAQVAEVEVDTETGEVDIIRFTAVHDCGRAINPGFAEGQIEGGIVMGMGFAVMEEMLEDRQSGEILSDSFVDYLIPTTVDSPGEIITELVECPDESGPFGATGIGEPSLVPAAPAIINAIYDAVGVIIYDLPATPEKVLRAINRRELIALL